MKLYKRGIVAHIEAIKDGQQMKVTDQERELIIAIRNVDSQYEKCGVCIFIHNYPDKYITCEYSDEFKTIPILNDEIEIGYRIELWNKMTLESYHILLDNDI